MRVASGDGDLHGACGPGGHDGEQADRPRAEHENPVPRSNAAESHTVHADGGRFRQSSHREVEFWWDGVDTLSGHCHVLGEAAVARDTEKLDPLADLIVACLAGRASSAHHERLDGDAVPDADFSDFPVDLRHLAGDLVSWANRGGWKRAGEPIQIAAADSTAAHSHQDLAGSQLGARKVAELEGSR